MLCWKPRLSKEDLISVVYYLLLQDRIGEAKKQFARLSVPFTRDNGLLTQSNPILPHLETKDEKKPESESTTEMTFSMQLQLDYLTAYLDFYTKSPTIAHTIAKKYTDYPIAHWRTMFNEIAEQLKEIKDKEEVEADEHLKNIANMKVISWWITLDL